MSASEHFQRQNKKKQWKKIIKNNTLKVEICNVSFISSLKYRAHFLNIYINRHSSVNHPRCVYNSANYVWENLFWDLIMSHAQIIIQCSWLYSNILSGMETKLKEKSSRSLFANWRLAHIHLHIGWHSEIHRFVHFGIEMVVNRKQRRSFFSWIFIEETFDFIFSLIIRLLHSITSVKTLLFAIGIVFLQFHYFSCSGSSIQLAHITHSLKSVCLNSVDKRKIKHKSEHFFFLWKSLCFSVFGKLPSIE